MKLSHKVKGFALLALLMGLYFPMVARSYFFSAKGDDANNGSKASPWRSLKKLSEIISTVASGDSLLFDRGSTFAGQLNISQSNLYIGPYGTGPKPVFTGSIKIDQWISSGKNLWRARYNERAHPTQLFINGKRQQQGRYPNKDYLTIAARDPGPLSVTDTTLKFADNYWNGATVIVRSSRWTFDHLPVMSYSNGIFNSSVRAINPLQNGAGYFIQNHLSTLDQPGEWFYDVRTGEVFLYLEQSPKDININIEMSVIAVGLNAQHSTKLIVENIVFKNYCTAGIRINHCDTPIVRDVAVFNTGENGLEMIACENPSVKNSTIADSGNNGVEWQSNTNGSFAFNTVRRTGLFAGNGRTGNGTHIGINITGDVGGANLFQRNTIDSSGYSGIDFRTGETQLKSNSISYFCLIKDDGGGIYTWENTKPGNIIEENIIDYGIGNGSGTINPNELLASGIYIDDRSANILVRNNTVTRCAAAGIFLHNAALIEVTGNKLQSNANSFANKERGQLYIKLDPLGKWGGNIALQLEVSKNKLVASDEISRCLFLSVIKEGDLARLGNFEQNEYSAAVPRQAIAAFCEQAALCAAPEELTLEMWQQKTHYESGSLFRKLGTRSNILLSKNLIGSKPGKSGWMTWPEKSSFEEVPVRIKDGLSFKFNIPVNTDALLYHAGFGLNKDKLYRLTFSAMTTKSAKLEFVPLMANSPWRALGDYACFTIDSTPKTFSYVFKPSQDNPEARVNFKSNSTFWIDHVSLVEVKVSERTNSVIR